MKISAHPATTFSSLLDWYLVVVVAGVLVVSLGVWNAGIPMGDEGVHVLLSLTLADHGGFSSNLYYTAYAFLFRVVTDDPVTAHLIMRLAVTLGATIGLYLVLTAFNSVSRIAIVIACMAWAASFLASPSYQDGNIHAFAFALVLPGLAYLLRYPTLNALLLFALGAIWAALVRPEYFASLATVALCGLAMVYADRKAGNTMRLLPRYTQKLGTAMLSLALAGSVGIAAGGKIEHLSLREARDALAAPFTGGKPLSPDRYLLLGLGQCYAVYYKKHNPQEQFDPMTEYQTVLNRVFGNPQNFFEALRNNPAEAAKYFAANGMTNLPRIVPAMLYSEKRLKFLLVGLILASGTIVGLARKFRRVSRSNALVAAGCWQERLKVLALLALTAASSVAVVLLIPVPRYWITWAPLVYLWLAWATDCLLTTKPVTSGRRFAVVVVLLTLCYPNLLAIHSNQDVVVALRAVIRELPANPTIAGNFVVPWAGFALRGQAVPINTYDGLSPEDLRARRYDIFIASGLEYTARWRDERPFLTAFKAAPLGFGYRELRRADASATDIFIRVN